MTAFSDLGLSDKTLQALTKKWFITPSPIQEQVIPLLLNGKKNIVWQAETGTGKTAAFGIPLIEKIHPGKHIQALILAPTRELAVQIGKEIDSLQSIRKLSVVAIYGKQSYEIQMRAIKRWVDILVGTPGRIIDHLNRKTLDISKIDYFILDEADEMLDMWFAEDIKTIFDYTNKEKKVLLFSATMPREIMQVAKKYMGEYDMVTIEKAQRTTTQTEQIYYEAQEKDKFEILRRVIHMHQDFYGLIFCHTKAEVDFVAARLHDEGYNAQGLHGDLAQRQRETILQSFKEKKITILVATDIAARGIDVNDISHVINYSLPQNAERYIHRVGRTGRAGKTGIAITFITPREYGKLSLIRKLTNTDIKKWIIPNVEDIITKKKTKLKTDIEGVLTWTSYEDFLPLADDLLTVSDARNIIAGLLKIYQPKEFDQTNYRDITPVTRNFERSSSPRPFQANASWEVRLFVALGRKNGFEPRSLLDMISKESNLASSHFNDLKMMDDYSFISVTPADAQTLIDHFANKDIQGKKSIINRAKEPSKIVSSFHQSGSGTRHYDTDTRRKPFADSNRRPFRADSSPKPYAKDASRKPFHADSSRKPFASDTHKRPFKSGSDRKPWGFKWSRARKER